jgi:transcriptional regulator with XRE-family HTH domain
VNGLDTVGEKLADVLGITSSRYAEYEHDAMLYREHVW